MSKLFEDSESDTETDIKTDNTYAKCYNDWRQKEELNKLKTKYGEEMSYESGSSTSSSEDEDDEALQITEEVERNFFKTLASLKTKDPKIYDENVQFFANETNIVSRKSKQKDKPMYIKDYERKLLLDKECPVGNNADSELCQTSSLTYTEEQEKLKRNLKDALKSITDDDSEDEWGGMFKNRKKTSRELHTEEEDYKQWLLGQKEDVSDDIKNDLKPLKDFWNDPKLDENEKFLRDYILNKRFMEGENKDYVPTYDEIIHDSDGLSDDEKQIEKQEEFEHKYNYRFEEPDEEFIKRYPRTIENSLRREDKKRKLKRAEVKERKQKEKQKKMEEIRQMQMLKKKEIEEKIQKLKEITGNTEIAFNDKDIEEDFDPAEHDKRMQHLFNDEFYQGEEEQKPEFPELDDELELENWEKYNFQESNEDTHYEPHCEDEDFNMDCDYNPTAVNILQTSKEKKKRRRKTKFAQIISEPKPAFNPDNKTYEEYLDEYYKLECEDVIGDIPCRFKYRKVIPNSFGLSVEEILMANDRELNRWCSLKKAVQYRPEHVEKYDVIAFERKGKNEALKRKFLPSLYKQEDVKVNSIKISENDEEKQKVKEKKNNFKINNMGNANEANQNKRSSVNSDKATKLSMSKKDKNNDPNIDTSKKDTTEKNILMKKKRKESQKSNLPPVLNCMNSVLSQNNSSNSDTYSHTKAEQMSKIKMQQRKRKLKTKNQADELEQNSIRNKFMKKDNFVELDISDTRLKAFGFKPKKFKNKLRYGQNINTTK